MEFLARHYEDIINNFDYLIFVKNSQEVHLKFNPLAVETIKL